MKKGLLASLIVYFALLIAVAAMMLTYILLKNDPHNVVNLQKLFKAVTYVFIAFVVSFAAVVVLLILYPKTLEKIYKQNIVGFVKEHLEKYPGTTSKAVVTYENKKVYVSFIMSEKEMDTYCFELKEKPLTKNEPIRIAYNILNSLLENKEIKDNA